MASPVTTMDATFLLLRGLPPLPIMAVGSASVTLLVCCLVLLAWRLRSSPTSSLLGNASTAAGARISDSARPTVKILFGTQTGTAERFAKQLRSALVSKYGDNVTFMVQDVEEYDWKTALLTDKAVVFLMATYGDGEPTDSAADFYGWLDEVVEDAANDASDSPLLKDLSYAVFGLGNKQYEHYAAAGKKLHKALAALGAVPLCRCGDGDDDDDIDADFDSWVAHFLDTLDGCKLGLVAKVWRTRVNQQECALGFSNCI